jgi:hypothetical protein
MIGLALFPVQLVLFQALGVRTPTFLLTQDLAAIPWGDASGVFVDHSTEFADACSVDVFGYSILFCFESIFRGHTDQKEAYSLIHSQQEQIPSHKSSYGYPAYN